MGWVTCFPPDWGQCRQRGLICTFCFPSGKLGCSPQRLHSGAPASNTVGKFSQRDIGCYRTGGRRCLRSPKCPAESPQTQTPLCNDLCPWYWEGGTESWRRHSEGAEYCLKDLRGCRLEENLICSTWLGDIFWPNIRKNLKNIFFSIFNVLNRQCIIWKSIKRNAVKVLLLPLLPIRLLFSLFPTSTPDSHLNGGGGLGA